MEEKFLEDVSSSSPFLFFFFFPDAKMRKWRKNFYKRFLLLILPKCKNEKMEEKF